MQLFRLVVTTTAQKMRQCGIIAVNSFVITDAAYNLCISSLPVSWIVVVNGHAYLFYISLL